VATAGTGNDVPATFTIVAGVDSGIKQIPQASQEEMEIA
jgi:hypothetical protein